MLRNRIIPVLLLQNKGLVKTKRFGSPVYLGDPINVINIFNEKEVDELIFLDIDATKNNLDIDFELIRDVSQECFMPFAYGGGVRTIKQLEKLFSIGVEKVIINSALEDRLFITKAVEKYGSQSIVAGIDIKRGKESQFGIYSYIKKKIVSYDIETYLTYIKYLNIGEIFINDVDNDGVMMGLDINLVKYIHKKISVPMIVCGGAGELKHLSKVISETEVSAIGAGSMFVFYGKHNAVLITYPQYSDLKKLEV